MNCRSTARGRKVTKSPHSVLGIADVLQAVNPPTPNPLPPKRGKGAKIPDYCFCDGSGCEDLCVTNLSLVQDFGFMFV